MTVDEAAKVLGVRTHWVIIHRSGDYLDPCLIEGSEPGIIKQSIDRELRWWRDATLAAKVRRRLKDVFQYF